MPNALVFVALLMVQSQCTVRMAILDSVGREMFRASLCYYPLKRDCVRVAGFIRKLVLLAILF